MFQLLTFCFCLWAVRCFFDRESVSAENLLPGNSGNQAKTMTSFTLSTHHYPTVCVCNVRTEVKLLQGVVAGSRVYNQRRHSGFPGDTWPDQPCVPALFSLQWQGLSHEPQQHFHIYTVAATLPYFRCCFTHCPHGIFPRWRRAKPRTLTWLFIWNLLVLESGFVHDRRFRNTYNLFAFYIEEIYLRSLFLIQLHVRGFSSQRITSMIHFLSSVWNLLVSCGKESFEWFVSQAGGERMVWQPSTKQDVAFPWWYDEGCHPSNWFSLEPGCIQLVGFEHNLYVFCQN